MTGPTYRAEVGLNLPGDTPGEERRLEAGDVFTATLSAEVTAAWIAQGVITVLDAGDDHAAR